MVDSMPDVEIAIVPGTDTSPGVTVSSTLMTSAFESIIHSASGS